jgi:predicted nucleic acid-binding protein
MRNIVVDTCIILHILRANALGEKCLDEIEKIGDEVTIIISVVTKAELESLKIQQNWGANRVQKLDSFLKSVICIDISSSDTSLLESYAQIDSYSKRKGDDKFGNALPGSSHTMGKNDLWIAATAYSLSTTLMTADGDFDHLNNTFLNIIKIS